jgi:uncharacterized protein YhbP (UPF0306 family)
VSASSPAASAHLRRRIVDYLRTHHTMTVATCGPSEVVAATATAVTAPMAGGGAASRDLPHAASVFYAVDADLGLVFLSKPSSTHGLHIGDGAPVAITITEEYADWEAIQGVQSWGEARRLTGMARAQGFAFYVRRFPFAAELLKRSSQAALARNIGVYRVEPRRFAFTDNTTGVFGRELLELMVE